MDRTELVIEPARGDFADWVRPHLSAMANLAARLLPHDDRDDAVQEALAAAWRKFDQFDPARGAPRSWLLAIVADQSRKSVRRRRVLEPLTDTEPQLDQPADLDLERAVARLPRRQRLAVALHYFLDLPVVEVADVMRCSEGTVKSTLSHARARAGGSVTFAFALPAAAVVGSASYLRWTLVADDVGQVSAQGKL